MVTTNDPVMSPGVHGNSLPFAFIPYPETETPQVLKNFYTLKSSYILDTLYFPDRNPVHAADFLK